MLRVDRANRDIKGPGFWRLDKANAEAVQANLNADFQRIAIKHHEEVTKLLTKQRDYVDKITQEQLIVGEPIPTTPNVEEIQRNPAKLLYIGFFFLYGCRSIPCGALSHERAIDVSRFCNYVIQIIL